MSNNKFARLTKLVTLVIGIFPVFAFALDAPRDVRGTEVKQHVVKWEWATAPGAERYEVMINGVIVDTTSKTALKSYDLFPGDYYMHVRSVGSDGSKSASSPTIMISTSETFNHGSHGRSVLTSQQPANDGVTPGSFAPPTGARGEETGPGTIRWRWNAVDAISYDVFLNGSYEGSTGSTEWTSSGLSIGNHSMTVRAVASDRRISDHSNVATVNLSTSSSSAISSSYGVNIPQNPRGEEFAPKDVRWRWDSVSGASKYAVTVDGRWAGETGNTEWISEDLWRGEHSLTVKAMVGGNWSPQSSTVIIIVTGGGSTQPPVAAAPPPPNPDAASVESLIDPESYNYPEVTGKEGWELSFSDEFNGTALNPYRWHSQLRWDGEWNGERYEYRIINNEAQFYVNTLSPDEEHQQTIVPLHDPFKFDGSRMAIEAKRNPLRDRNLDRLYGRLEDVARQQPFLSGAISTHGKFSQKYGYFEARIRIPSHVGTFPAFWLFHERRAWEGTQRTEIDIMENLGHAPWYVYNSFHYFKNVSTTYSGDANFVKPRPSGQIYMDGTDFSQDYHVYAVKWSPDNIVWYIDGQQVSELTHGEVNYEELYVMLNLAMGGNWTNFPENAGGLGRSGDQRYPTNDDINNFSNPRLEIDYVRVYKPR